MEGELVRDKTPLWAHESRMSGKSQDWTWSPRQLRGFDRLVSITKHHAEVWL